MSDAPCSLSGHCGKLFSCDTLATNTDFIAARQLKTKSMMQTPTQLLLGERSLSLSAPPTPNWHVLHDRRTDRGEQSGNNRRLGGWSLIINKSKQNKNLNMRTDNIDKLNEHQQRNLR